MDDFWLKQNPADPLFSDILWSRPETKARAGKLLIVGGNKHSFNRVSEAYKEANAAGAGECLILLPDALQKTLQSVIAGAHFSPSTPSGGLARQALAELLDHAKWADGVLIAGDLGKNAETSVLLESFIRKYSGLLCLVNDGADEYINTPSIILDRSATILTVNIFQLQKLAVNVKFDQAFTSDMGLTRFIKIMHDFTLNKEVAVVSYLEENILVAHRGRVSTTKKAMPAAWQTILAARAIVWSIQNSQKLFEAITSSVI